LLASGRSLETFDLINKVSAESKKGQNFSGTLGKNDEQLLLRIYAQNRASVKINLFSRTDPLLIAAEKEQSARPTSNALCSKIYILFN
jgi:hypothetical protein